MKRPMQTIPIPKLTAKPMVKASATQAPAGTKSMIPAVRKATRATQAAGVPDRDMDAYAYGGVVGNTRGPSGGPAKTCDDAAMNRSGWKRGGGCPD